ncbi:hypothetical protein HOLleu_20684 [Holothuria leucospilota]|uniref:Reverse transcriptase domain-containing protein n=1 Tax=Holothuria leucospilota TaxID=206669 RepID=A0A9Q1H8M5_HOLLE|nr:hypothetical protein HOLleu_20684 [Holothuria leucospilota]
MENFETAVRFITKDCFMASLDLKDAYFSVPIHKSSQKYHRFRWKGQIWQFKALPNGLSPGPRIFTKILKVPMAALRSLGHIIIPYIDDTLLIAQSRLEALHALKDTIEVLSRLGFSIHPQKSVLEPCHEIKFLGFIINSKEMMITLTEPKVKEIREFSLEMLTKNKFSIRKLACYIGKVVAALPGSQYGQLHYRELEWEKIRHLALSRGNFDKVIGLNEKAKQELRWWYEHVALSCRLIQKPKVAFELHSDASGEGWGATNGSIHIGGRWQKHEKLQFSGNSINYLELLAAYFALKSFCKAEINIHERLRIDNTTAVAYRNNMGGIKSVACDDLAKELWSWCINRQIWVSAAHLPGDKNVIADRKSRLFRDETEWMLHPQIFDWVYKHLGKPTIDLFATRLNTQLTCYVSRHPDPEAHAVDAFMLDWSSYNFYAFPPFCLIDRCLQKIVEDKAEGVMVVPKWATQSWFPQLLAMLIADPIMLPKNKSMLLLPARGVPQRARGTILASWRESTRKQYGTCIKKWIKFCDEKSYDTMSTTTNIVLDFLVELKEEGLSYSAINTARSALASFVVLNSGQATV